MSIDAILTLISESTGDDRQSIELCSLIGTECRKASFEELRTVGEALHRKQESALTPEGRTRFDTLGMTVTAACISAM